MQNLAAWPKRDDLYSYLDNLLLKNIEQNPRIAVFILNLDNFRELCELFGYRNIEEYLAQVGKIIRDACPINSYAAWLGSDEFAVVIPETTTEQAQLTAAKICQNVTQPIVFYERRTYITVSIGYVVAPEDAHDRYEMLKNATIAMNWVKKHGKNGFTRYEPTMSEQVNRKLTLVNDFSVALADNQFFLQYQPQVNVSTGAIIGAEALLRWHHPRLGLIPPLEFIPLAEETGYIHSIGEWVLRNACRDFSSWLKAGLMLKRLAVNVSIIQLQKHDFAQRLLKILDEAELDPAYLELEITEGQTIDLPQVRPQIEQLRNHGVRFAIDDFGTGFASLNHLRYMGFDTIKIDKAYIHNIITNNRDQVIVNSIMNMATLLQLGLIAEGVETYDQWQYIRQTSIKEVQGYYCSPPVDKEKFELLAAGESCR